MRRRLAVLTAAFFALGSTLAGAATITLIPPGARPGGQNADTSVRHWVEWSHSINRKALGGDPITDPNGAFQAFNQRFPVTMLGGALQRGVQRTFTIEGGKPVLIPLLNATCYGNAAVGTCIGDESGRDLMDAAHRLVLRINGQTLVDARGASAVDALEPLLRFDTGLFAVDVPDGSWPTALGLPADLYPESYHVGFYAFADLPLGSHAVEFGGVTGDFANTVEARVNVVPIPAAMPLLGAALAFLAAAAGRRRRAASA